MPGSAAITDPEKAAAAEKVVAQMTRIRKHMADEFRAGVTNGRVVEIAGANHYLFQTNEAEVVGDMLAFLRNLKR